MSPVCTSHVSHDLHIRCPRDGLDCVPRLRDFQPGMALLGKTKVNEGSPQTKTVFRPKMIGFDGNKLWAEVGMSHCEKVFFRRGKGVFLKMCVCF